MNEKADVIALANFLATYENLEINKRILESNQVRNAQEAVNAERQELLLEEIISLLKERKQ